MEGTRVGLFRSDHALHTSATFQHLHTEADFSDVTLVCEDYKQLQAHRLILASGSGFFKNLFQNLKQVPVIYLRLKLTDLQELLRFIYLGYCEVEQVRVKDFLDLARELEVTGLSPEMEGETKLYQKSEKVLDDNIIGSDDQLELEHNKNILKRERNSKRTEYGAPHSVDRNEVEVGFTEFTEDLAPRCDPWQRSWEELVDMNGERFGEYLKPCDEKNARCTRCNTVFKFSSGVTSLKRHSETVKHQANSKHDMASESGIFAVESSEPTSTGSIFDLISLRETFEKEETMIKRESKKIKAQLEANYPVDQHIQNNEVEMNHTENFTPVTTEVFSKDRVNNWLKSWEDLLDLNGEKYGEYLEPSGKKNAKCKRCDRIFKFSKCGITALKRHSESRRHKANSNIGVEIDNSIFDDDNFSIIKC